MPTYFYPEARKLEDIGPNLVVEETRDDILFDILPIQNVPASMLQWSVEDDPDGLQQLRGLDGAPVHVVDKLAAALLKVMAQPKVKDALLRQGSVLTPLGPKEFAPYMAMDTERWRSVAATIRYQPTAGKPS